MKRKIICFFFLIGFASVSNAQIIPRKDTIQRDIGISVNWRSLPFLPQSNKVSDIVGGFHFALETRVHNFWIQTGVLVNWNSDRGFDQAHSFLLTLSVPYEFEILKRRLILGLGPTFNYYYDYRAFNEWNELSSSTSHGIAFGAIFEITVPIWKGLSLEICSDASVGPYFSDGGKPEIFIPSARLVSLGINHRIPAYPK
ncbi:MAG: hypothetical protein K9J17_09095 [Flavobacteriales bacterium]|nr:hypothetical protein [Flavobacteriales bacterium]